MQSLIMMRMLALHYVTHMTLPLKEKSNFEMMSSLFHSCESKGMYVFQTLLNFIRLFLTKVKFAL